MGEKRQKPGEDSQRIMVNSDDELIEALKDINKTLKVKEIPEVKRKIIYKKRKEKENG